MLFLILPARARSPAACSKFALPAAFCSGVRSRAIVTTPGRMIVIVGTQAGVWEAEKVGWRTPTVREGVGSGAAINSAETAIASESAQLHPLPHGRGSPGRHTPGGVSSF